MNLKTRFSVYIILLVFLILSGVTVLLIQIRSSEIRSELNVRYTFLAQKLLPDLTSNFGEYYYYAYATYKESILKQLSTYPDLLRIRLYNQDAEMVFDSATMANSDIAQEPTKVVDAAILEATNKKSIVSKDITTNGVKQLRIIVPYIDQYNTFRMIADYTFSLKEVQSAINGLIVYSTIILIISTAVSVVLSIFFVEQITEPIIRLTKAAEEIRKGNLQLTVDVRSKDEIGKLAESFNTMAQELKTSRAALEDSNKNLEDQVSSRTKELQGKMEEMEQLQKLTIDRELKMVELKNEIARLTSEKPA